MSGVNADWIEELARFPLRALDDEAALLAQRRVEAMRAFEQSLPPLYRLSAIDNRLLPERVKTSSLTHDRPRGRAAFFGPSGRGKTRLAVSFLRAAAAEHVQRNQFESDDAVDRVPTQFRFADARELGVCRMPSNVEGPIAIQLALRAELLLLDDLGSEASIPSSPLADIIAARHSALRATWITTELSAEQVATRYGGGCARRVYEGATVLGF